jgi:hypothetical protein
MTTRRLTITLRPDWRAALREAGRQARAGLWTTRTIRARATRMNTMLVSMLSESLNARHG